MIYSLAEPHPSSYDQLRYLSNTPHRPVDRNGPHEYPHRPPRQT
jgi:hypothetical protein